MPTFTTPVLLFQNHDIYHPIIKNQFSLYDNLNIDPLVLSSLEEPVESYKEFIHEDTTPKISNYQSKIPVDHQSPRIKFSELKPSIRDTLNNIMEAVRLNDETELTEWLNDFADYASAKVQLSNYPFKDNLSPLYVAASKGYTSIVKLLLNRCDLNLDYVNDSGESALAIASMEGHTDIVSLLLESGADSTLCNNHGTTPLHKAAGNNKLEAVIKLVELGNVDVNAQDKGGVTPLMLAATRDCINVISYLVSLEEPVCDILASDGIGETAYSIAASDAKITICNILEQAESEFKAKNNINSESKHPTQLIYIYENQRSKPITLMKRFFAGSTQVEYLSENLLKQDKVSTYTMKATGESITGEVSLPQTQPLPNRSGWVWGSEWSVVSTGSSNSAEDGWLYAKHFDVPDNQWSSEPLKGTTNQVRRRKWIRIATQLPKY